MKSEHRTAYVDIAKGIAILAVVLLHVDFVYPKLSFINISAMLGWYWHVPVFFLIGGFFLKEERLLQPVSFIKGKFKSLYLLALYIYLPATLLHNVLFQLGWYSPDVVYGGKIIAEWDVKEYGIGIIKTLLCAGREPIMGAMWFVYALLFALCGYSIICFIVNKCKWGGTSSHLSYWRYKSFLVSLPMYTELRFYGSAMPYRQCCCCTSDSNCMDG